MPLAFVGYGRNYDRRSELRGKKITDRQVMGDSFHLGYVIDRGEFHLILRFTDWEILCHCITAARDVHDSTVFFWLKRQTRK
jgi:hypothetical protein